LQNNVRNCIIGKIINIKTNPEFESGHNPLDDADWTNGGGFRDKKWIEGLVEAKRH
jgi:hypothetical protein